MNISELIQELQKIQEQHGDLTVLANDECGSAKVIQRSDLVATTDDNYGARLEIDC